MPTLTEIIALFARQAVAALFMYCDCWFLLLVFRFYAMEMELVASTFKLRFLPASAGKAGKHVTRGLVVVVLG